jgi:hypothetical protein
MSSSATRAPGLSSDRFISYPLDSAVRERLLRCGERLPIPDWLRQMPTFFDVFRTIMFMDSTFTYMVCGSIQHAKTWSTSGRGVRTWML